MSNSSEFNHKLVANTLFISDSSSKIPAKISRFILNRTISSFFLFCCGDGQTRQFVFEFSAFSSFQFSSVMVINICEDYENRGEDYIFSAKITIFERRRCFLGVQTCF